MSELITKLTSENKDYLFLLTNFVRNLAVYQDIKEEGIEALVNISGKDFNDSAKDKLIWQFAPLNLEDSMMDSFTKSHDYVDQQLKRSEIFFKKLMLDFVPTDKLRQYEEFLHCMVWHPEQYTKVDVRQFTSTYLEMTLGFTATREMPEFMNLLDPNRGENISNMYFAALHKLNGFPPHHNDRATENLFNVAFLEGGGEKRVAKFCENMKNLTDEDKFTDFVVRLPSEYLKAMLFNGNIAPSKMPVKNFFNTFYKKFEEKKDVFGDALFEVGGKGTGYDSDYNYIHEIIRNPIEFIASWPSENMDRFLRSFNVKNYEDILDLFFEDIPKIPHLITLNSSFFESDKDYSNFASFVVNSTEEIRDVSTGSNKNALQLVQRHVLDNYRSIFPNITLTEDNSRLLFRALKNYKDKEYPESRGQEEILKSYAETGYYIANIFKDKSLMFLEGLLSEKHDKLLLTKENLPKAFIDNKFTNLFGDFVQHIDKSLEFLAFFSNFGLDVKELQIGVLENTLTLNNIHSNYSLLMNNHLAPTPHLIKSLSESNNPSSLIESWKKLLDNNFNSDFDPTNNLHINLGYTQFDNVLSNSHFKKKVSDKFKFTWNFDSYKELLQQKNAPSGLTRDDYSFRWNSAENYSFEIDCAAYESSKLMEFIDTVKSKTDNLGRELLIVPNLSYGYVPLIPLYDELLEKNIKVFMGAKIGSTDAHYNPSVFDNSLFKGIEEYLINKKPVIMVIDGTQHMIDRDDNNLSARYPDAYQGFLNYVIALNELHGFSLEGYIGKSSEDMTELRKLFGFNEFVHQYTSKKGQREMYSFELWNTANLPLILRKDKKKAVEPKQFDISDLTGPAMIFCNVGLTDEQIPDSLKTKYNHDYKHIPAFFDDTGHIINLELQVSKEGIIVHNAIEPLLKQAYAKYSTIKPFNLQSNYINTHPNHIVRETS